MRRLVPLIVVLMFAGCSAEQLGMGLEMGLSASKSYLVMESADMTPEERENLVNRLREYADIAAEISDNLHVAADRSAPPATETDP